VKLGKKLLGEILKMNLSLAVDSIQKTKRFQVLAGCGLMLTYPFLLIPVLFKALLGIEPETLEVMSK
jgi:hypothetical protein